MPRTGRNEPCPCGSGRKYKLCHGAGATSASPPAPADRRAVEAAISNLARMMRSQDFTSLEDAQRFVDAHIDELDAGNVPPPTSTVEAAQELMYAAWDATGRERARLARQALTISADCADAYVLLAEEAAATPAEAAALYREGVAAGERFLGERMQTDEGHFWGEIETRPYMRARAGLAEALWALGREDEALGHMWELLRLNPNDNQGTRDVLLPRVLARKDHAGAHRVLDLFAEDGTAIFAYGRALLAYQKQGASTTANTELDKALRTNHSVPQYLLGARRLPRRLPETIGFGDEDEAVCCAAEHLDAWAATDGALDWLRQRWKDTASVGLQGRAGGVPRSRLVRSRPGD